eukprot:482407-Rhodomonas_salina.1
MSDETLRREKVPARTSGPPRWEDSSDRDSWLFIRFVPVDLTGTKEFVDREVANLQEKLNKAKQVFSTTLPSARCTRPKSAATAKLQ